MTDFGHKFLPSHRLPLTLPFFLNLILGFRQCQIQKCLAMSLRSILWRQNYNSGCDQISFAVSKFSRLLASIFHFYLQSYAESWQLRGERIFDNSLNPQPTQVSQSYSCESDLNWSLSISEGTPPSANEASQCWVSISLDSGVRGL